MSFMIKGMGGFGYKGKGAAKIIPKLPDRKPDCILKGDSFRGQAFIYRLTGDINPLHIDPNIASLQKFERPIMHGLGSYGIVARAITQQFLDNDPEKITSYHARFLGHVFPGESLKI
eukprot:GHVR01168686.1.p1 GENE.GHVR01168686.1~~GHVR01168686.1.p1  ORF type:complete len:117 (+),score=7.54 GHVR01168686.1:59-409(+)